MKISESTLSRRLSEFTGVALFALALIWVIALGSYSASDPVWFFKTADTGVPGNFAGRIGAFIAEASLQLLGYAAWIAPIAVGVAGWNAFWCQKLEAAYTKLIGIVLMVTSLAALLSLVFRAVAAGPRAVPAGGVLGDWFAAELAEYLNMTGGTILLFVLLALSVILSTQFSSAAPSAAPRASCACARRRSPDAGKNGATRGAAIVSASRLSPSI
jgi:S-DNA-T family DNA segregation ATPase FtsK/SpoIIIE